MRPSFEEFANSTETICVAGLVYVGLPRALVFVRKFKVVGFDINMQRVRELSESHDRTRELTTEQLQAVSLLSVKYRELVQQFDLPVLQSLGGTRAPVSWM